MQKKYPNPCCHCGMCCIAETCIVGQAHFNIKKEDNCPGLSFNSTEAICALVDAGLIPTGDGCCISARCYWRGVKYDYASLSPEIKRTTVRNIRRNQNAK